jgi:hypothetical protein
MLINVKSGNGNVLTSTIAPVGRTKTEKRYFNLRITKVEITTPTYTN